MENERYYITSIIKALKTLKQFTSEERELTLTELTIKTGYNKSNMIRILATLSSEGFIRYNEKIKKYSLGYAIHTLNNTMGFVNIKQICRPFLENAAIESQCLIHLSVLEDDKIVVIDRVFPELGMEALVLASSIGGTVPVHCTGAGKIIAAFTDEEEKNTLLNSCKFEKYSEKTITERKDLERIISETKIKGYAINEGEHEPYLTCLTRPIFDSNNKLLAAVSISGLKEMLIGEKLNEINKISENLANELSIIFGYKK